MLARKVSHLFCEQTCVVDRTWGHLICVQDTVCNGDAVIIFTKCRSLVDDTSTIRICNVRIYNNAESLVFILEVK